MSLDNIHIRRATQSTNRSYALVVKMPVHRLSCSVRVEIISCSHT